MAKKSRAELKAERNRWRDSARYWSGAWSELDGEYVQQGGDLGLALADARRDLEYWKDARLRLEDSHGDLSAKLEQALEDAAYQKEQSLFWHAEYMGILDQALKSPGLEKELADVRTELAVADIAERAKSEKLAGLAEALTGSEDARLLGEKKLAEVTSERDELRRQVAGARQAAEQLNKALYPMKLIAINPDTRFVGKACE